MSPGRPWYTTTRIGIFGIGAYVGILDAHVWTCHPLQAFQLHIWTSVRAGIQDSHVPMQSWNIEDSQRLVHMWAS